MPKFYVEVTERIDRYKILHAHTEEEARKMAEASKLDVDQWVTDRSARFFYVTKITRLDD